MRPQSGKAKGRRLQQCVANALCTAFDLAPDDVRSTSMGAGGEDVQLSSRARQQIPYSFECKNQERLNVWASLEQAAANAPNGSTPVLIIKRNHAQTHAVLPFEHFLELIQPRSHASTHASDEAIQHMEAAIRSLQGKQPPAEPR